MNEPNPDGHNQIRSPDDQGLTRQDCSRRSEEVHEPDVDVQVGRGWVQERSETTSIEYVASVIDSDL